MRTYRIRLYFFTKGDPKIQVGQSPDIYEVTAASWDEAREMAHARWVAGGRICNHTPAMEHLVLNADLEWQAQEEEPEAVSG